jgi:hypothetical protein
MSYTGSGKNPNSSLSKQYADIVAYVWSDYANELPQFQANPEQYLQKHGFPVHQLVPAGIPILLAVDAPIGGQKVYWMKMPAPPNPGMTLMSLQQLAEADWPYDTE